MYIGLMKSSQGKVLKYFSLNIQNKGLVSCRKKLPIL